MAGQTVVALLARTVSGDSGLGSGFGDRTTMRCQLNVTAASGTAPTLDAVVEDTLDGTTFNTIGTFTQAVAATRQVVNVTTPFTDRVRVRWTVGGTTPSFTFAVDIYSE